MDEVTLHVESMPGSAGAGAQTEELQKLIKSYVGISCDVTLHEVGGIPRSEGKAKRVIDRR